jgi:hypothetical protein
VDAVTFRDILRDPDARALLLLAGNVLGGLVGARLTILQVRRAARKAAAAAVLPLQRQVISLDKRVGEQADEHEKFRGRVLRFLLAKRRKGIV